MSALGALTLPSVSYSFDNKGTAMVPVTAGRSDKVLGKIEVTSPIQQMSEFFAGIDKSLINLVEFAKKSFSLEEKDAQREGLQRQDTDDKPTVEGDNKSMLDSLKESFDSLGDAFGNVSIGEKLGAALLVGSLLLFQQVQGALVKVLTPVIAGVKKLVEIFGFDGVFLTFLGIITAIKFTPLITGAFATAKILGPGIWKGVGIAFKAVNFAVGGLLTGAKFALKALGGGFKLLFDGIGLAFKGIKIGLVAMRTSLIPIAAGFVVPIAIAAAIGAVLFSLKSSIEVFKAAIDDGDSVMSALVKAGKDFFATLYTLPFTLIKNVVSYFAGMFGFDNFKEKLDSIDLKQGFIDIITSFVDKVKGFFAAIFDFDIKGIIDRIGNIGSQIANTLKGIAKGAVAMVAAAVPGGESPTEAFTRVYNEVLNTGEGVVKNEAAEIASKPLVEDGAMAAAKAAMTTNESYITNDTTFNNTTNMMKEKIIELMKIQLEKTQIEQESKSSAPILVNNSKGGDTNVNNNTTNVSGELAVEHSDPTSRLINNAIA
mgnify:FL=1|jgi:hypothetical protein|tara:strand:- start:42 stop:1664 length:1623 start_codon:yes stop_codon:yes gene_type:complete